MNQQAISLRAFIGSRDFEISRRFYLDLGFEESQIDPRMSYFHKQGLGFYLQDAYVKDWLDNTMLFMEVENVEEYWLELQKLDLPKKYEGVKLAPVRYETWGKECFLHDPAGVLWHFGQFTG